MKRKIFVFLIAGLLVNGLSAWAGPPTVLHSVIPNQYVIQFVHNIKDVRGNARNIAKAVHGTAKHHFTKAIKGFSIHVPPGTDITALESDPRILRIVPNIVFKAFGKGGTKGSHKKGQELPTGVDRIDADLNLNIANGVNVAVIDTGVDPNHPDLSVLTYNGTNFTDEGSPDDPDDLNGHGTHVAGTVGARDNDIGVVGVAPGINIIPIKVLNWQGSGTYAQVIAGVDWVTRNAHIVDVANMSLGGAKGPLYDPNNDPLHDAITAAVDAGVTFAVAAGNESDDANNYIPAAYDEVITVSAIKDKNGQPGETVRVKKDKITVPDTFAWFSNYGEVVDIAAPGVSIYSTTKSGGYTTMSGTSMAAPHVSGAAALFIKTYFLSTGLLPLPLEVENGLLSAATPQDDGINGFTGDPDSFPEPLLNAEQL